MAGFVLAGGASRRMGEDKALLPIGNQTLVERVASEVRAAAGDVTLVGGGGRYSRFGYATVDDLYPGEGPLGGIITALRHSGAELNLIVACDMPGIRAEALRRLLGCARRSAASVVVLETGDGRAHPLCGVYGLDVLDRLELTFAAGVRSLQEALRSEAVERVPAPDERWAANVNTPEEWAAFAAAHEL